MSAVETQEQRVERIKAELNRHGNAKTLSPADFYFAFKQGLLTGYIPKWAKTEAAAKPVETKIQKVVTMNEIVKEAQVEEAAVSEVVENAEVKSEETSEAPVDTLNGVRTFATKKERDEFIVHCAKSKFKSSAIAQMVGLSKMRVYKILKAAGVTNGSNS